MCVDRPGNPFHYVRHGESGRRRGLRPRDAGGFLHRLFALAFAYAQAYGRPYAPQPAEPEPDPPAEPERAEEAVSAPEIPPVPESQWTRTEIPVDPQPEKQPDVEAILKGYSSKTE